MNISAETRTVAQETQVLFKVKQSAVAEQPFPRKDEFADEKPLTSQTTEQVTFNELLSWLAPDPETAGREYELIRQKLITLFTCRRCLFPEELADETINRVTRKLPQLKFDYIGSPIKYFYGTAKKVYLEYLRHPAVQQLPPGPAVKEDLEELFQGLDQALSKLEPSDRELILSYYQGDGKRKITHRKALAKQLGLDLNTLRVRIYRIKSQLKSHLNL
jgi:RNA polymerase sigma factor (sigma-70 family)